MYLLKIGVKKGQIIRAKSNVKLYNYDCTVSTVHFHCQKWLYHACS